MTVTVVEKGRHVRVTPDKPLVEDVLEYAEALIDTFGWNAEGGTVGSNEQNGYSLHDAVGEANERLFPTSGGGRGGKEGPTMTDEGQTMRTLVMARLNKVLPQGGAEPDKAFNDKAKKVEDIKKVLAAARAAT